MTTPDFDLSQLSEAQQLALQQYTSVTDQELAAAVPLLQRSQWNVEVCKTRVQMANYKWVNANTVCSR